MGVFANLGHLIQSFFSPEEAAAKQMEKEREQGLPRERTSGRHTNIRWGTSGQRTNISSISKRRLEQECQDQNAKKQREWLMGLTESQSEEWRQEVLRSIGKSIPSDDALVDEVRQRAWRMRTLRTDIGVPFTPLEEFELDGMEQQCTQVELNGSGLSEDDFDQETWQVIVRNLYVTKGVHMAAEARFRDGDYTGALQSWIKWLSIQGRIAPIEEEDKKEWLLLAKIYAGIGRIEDAQKALAWAEAAKEADEPPDPTTPWTNQYEEHDWNKQISEVLQQIERPSS